MVKVERLHQWNKAFLKKYEFMKEHCDYKEDMEYPSDTVSKRAFKRYRKIGYMTIMLEKFESCDVHRLVNRDMLFYTGMMFLDVFALEDLLTNKGIKGRSVEEKCKNFFKPWEYKIIRKYISL